MVVNPTDYHIKIRFVSHKQNQSRGGILLTSKT